MSMNFYIAKHDT